MTTANYVKLDRDAKSWLNWNKLSHLLLCDLARTAELCGKALERLTRSCSHVRIGLLHVNYLIINTNMICRDYVIDH